MGLSAVMDIGKSGLNIYRIAQEVTGENIANVDTPGYSRQRVIMETAPTTTSGGFTMGSGARIATIERYYDALLQKQTADAQTTQGYDTTKSSVLQQIEPTFNEIANDGLGVAISNFFGAWQDLTLNPDGSAERQAVLSRAQILTDNFHSVSTTLNDSINSLNDSLTPLADSINATLKSIAQLNGEIITTEQLGGNSNETRDQRDQLIRDLSKQIGITYTENSNGTTDIKYSDGGATLVDASTAGSFSLATNSGTGLYDVYMNTPAGTTTLANPATGQLGAVLALRDTIIPGYLSNVNDLATTIITEVNSLHTAGFQHDGTSAGTDFFSGTSAADIGLNISTANQVAASGVSGLVGDNSNALKIAQLQNKLTMSSGTATFNDYHAGIVSQVGLDVQSSKNAETLDVAFTKQLATLRESNSGVSLDEELTNLVKYQRSYQASAKLITTATDMMDTVLGLIR